MIIEAMGFPFPGGVMVMFSGFLVNQNEMDFYKVFLVAVIGFNIGAIAAFLIGWRMGESIFNNKRFKGVTKNQISRARSWMEHSAPLFIIAGRFVPMISNLTPYMAGASGLKLVHFLFYNFIFTVIWVSANISVGMVFGQKWPEIAAYMHNSLPLAILALVIVYFVVKFFIKHIYEARSEKI
ncbi:DedA family protein [Desulfotruncus arcticus]|uniref:DedA family protein n=1 Tax=Desulfotruncus arcticus TaxID=341036 RepID=UPI001EE3BD35|nr:DedA family protein [Desulfotruncus arcticus]